MQRQCLQTPRGGEDCPEFDLDQRSDHCQWSYLCTAKDQLKRQVVDQDQDLRSRSYHVCRRAPGLEIFGVCPLPRSHTLRTHEAGGFLNELDRARCCVTWRFVKLGGNVLLEPAAAIFLMLILVMVVNFPGNSLFPVSHTQSHNELINYSNFPGSHHSHEVKLYREDHFPRKSTPGSQLSGEVNFSGKSTFPGNQL